MLPEITTDTPQIPLNDLIQAKTMADRLHKEYPGHLWAVTHDGAKGICTIRNLMLSGTMGYILKVREFATVSEFERAVMRAGGEVLERYRIARAKADNEQLAFLPTDFAGRHEYDRG